MFTNLVMFLDTLSESQIACRLNGAFGQIECKFRVYYLKSSSCIAS